MYKCVSTTGRNTVMREIPSISGFTSSRKAKTMTKIKFRVYVNKPCPKCKQIHEQPTHRYIFYVGDGDVHDVIQAGHAYAVRLLEAEADNLRPFFQRVIEVGR